MVETEKSVRILTSALTWFFLRTVPSSRKANPACIASTMMPPSNTNNTSLPVFNASMPTPVRIRLKKQIAFQQRKSLISKKSLKDQTRHKHHFGAMRRSAHRRGASLSIAGFRLDAVELGVHVRLGHRRVVLGLRPGLDEQRGDDDAELIQHPDRHRQHELRDH